MGQRNTCIRWRDTGEKSTRALGPNSDPTRGRPTCCSDKKFTDLIILAQLYNYTAQFSSVTHLCLTLGNPTDCSTPASLSITNSQSLLKLIFTELVMPSNHLILCHPLLFPPSIFPSIRVFSSESVLHNTPKYWSFSLKLTMNIQD